MGPTLQGRRTRQGEATEPGLVELRGPSGSGPVSRDPSTVQSCSLGEGGRQGGGSGDQPHPMPGCRAGLGRGRGRRHWWLQEEIRRGWGWWGRGMTPEGTSPLGLEGGREPVEMPTAPSGKWEVGAELVPGPLLCGLTHSTP